MIFTTLGWNVLTKLCNECQSEIGEIQINWVCIVFLVVEESEVDEAAKEGTEIKTPDEIPVHDLELTATVGKVMIEILIFNSFIYIVVQ